MRIFGMLALSFAFVATVCVAQGSAPSITFDQLFPPSAHSKMASTN